MENRTLMSGKFRYRKGAVFCSQEVFAAVHSSLLENLFPQLK
jgi:hypothetical protein